jgi:acyl carrier protein
MVLDKIKELLSTQFELDIDTITADTDIMTDLGADSLDVVELITELEDEYGVSATDEAIYQCKTVGDLAEFIENLLS